jgi:mRNA interferase MazF
MKDPVKRYDIFFADLNPTVGSEIQKIRPVVVVSKNDMNTHLETVVVCPLTTRLHPRWRSRIQTVCEHSPAEIAVDQIRTISRRRLIRRAGTISADESLKLRLLITEMYGE